MSIENRIDTPVNPQLVDELRKTFPDFERVYTENGIAVEEFDTFEPTRRTLRQFIEAAHQLEGQIRDIMLPNPDKEITGTATSIRPHYP